MELGTCEITKLLSIISYIVQLLKHGLFLRRVGSRAGIEVRGGAETEAAST
jgi:hypothetical protein